MTNYFTNIECRDQDDNGPIKEYYYHKVQFNILLNRGFCLARLKYEKNRKVDQERVAEIVKFQTDFYNTYEKYSFIQPLCTGSSTENTQIRLLDGQHRLSAIDSYRGIDINKVRLNIVNMIFPSERDLHNYYVSLNKGMKVGEAYLDYEQCKRKVVEGAVSKLSEKYPEIGLKSNRPYINKVVLEGKLLEVWEEGICSWIKLNDIDRAIIQFEYMLERQNTKMGNMSVDEMKRLYRCKSMKGDKTSQYFHLGRLMKSYMSRWIIEMFDDEKDKHNTDDEIVDNEIVDDLIELE